MPFFLIPSALGLSFLLIWFLIGGMIFHDGQAAALHDIEVGSAIYRVGAAAAGVAIKLSPKRLVMTPLGIATD